MFSRSSRTLATYVHDRLEDGYSMQISGAVTVCILGSSVREHWTQDFVREGPAGICLLVRSNVSVTWPAPS
jgi:hypothetical protein